MTANDTDPPITEPESTPEDAFALIGNEIRVAIIRVLGDAFTVADGNPGFTFSEIRSRLDTEVDPGQLNYHMKQLVGQFVEKTGNEYGLRADGLRLYHNLRAGVFEQKSGESTIDTGFSCHYCQATVEAIFSEGRAKIECPECGYRYLTDIVAPSLVAFADEADAYEQFSKIISQKFLGYARGICHICGNPVGTKFVDPTDGRSSDEQRSKVYVRRSCDHCGLSYSFQLGVMLLTDPDLISFCYDHGVEIFSTPYWELEFAATDKNVTVRSTDPWEVVLRVTYEDETLELVVDGDLTVLESNRFAVSHAGRAAEYRGGAGAARRDELPDRVEANLPSDSEDCLQYLRVHRWPNGVTCPHCWSDDTSKHGTTSKGAQRYRCRTCESGFNDLTGTIFAERGLTIEEMFRIIREMESTDTAQIARELGRSYNTVMDFVHAVQNVRCEETVSGDSDVLPGDDLSGLFGGAGTE